MRTLPTLLCFVVLGLSLCRIASSTEITVADLPLSRSLTPEAVPHFPDNLHAFVWRNWNLVPIERLAVVVDTTPENIAAIAASLGLPEYRPPTWPTRQIYITIVRRNWHLLPYAQLLKLVEMTPERFSFALREDDFLQGKMGPKPNCKPVRYAKPSEAAEKRAAEIARVLKESVGESLLEKVPVARCAFIDDLKKVDDEPLPAPFNPDEPPRFIYSYFALYGDPLSGDDAEIFPDGLLQKLRRLNVNGVWMHVVLRELAPGGEKFPEFGHGHEKRLETLRKVVARAKKYGIGIYLYLNEPRAMPTGFFKNASVPGRADIAGVGYTHRDLQSMCITMPDVQNWMRDSLTHIFKEVPELAGVFTISRGENPTHCHSRSVKRRKGECPHCSKRSAGDIVMLVNTLIKEGVHRAAPDAKVILWDWQWNSLGRVAKFIELLPKDVWLMSASEWWVPLHRGGIESRVGEYSISAVGPGPRALEHWKTAKARGLKTVAKVQLNCTWEISAVPYVPVMDLIAEHCSNLKQQDIDGMMLSWTLGGYPSPNLEIPKMFDREAVPTQEAVLDELALERYGPEGAKIARQAWTVLSEAYREYPFHVGVLYKAPVQTGPANLFRDKATGRRATTVSTPYDDLTLWRSIYPAEVFIGQFEKMAQGFARGIELLEKAVALAPKAKRPEVEAECRYAKVCRLHFASVANQARFILLRDERDLAETAESRRNDIRREMSKIIENEIELALELYRLTLEDSAIGFESSNHYYYVPNDLLEKIVGCRQLLAEMKP